MSAALKKPAAAARKRPASALASAVRKKPAASRAQKKPAILAPQELQGLKAFIINLERRPDRWSRVSKMLEKQVPWLDFEKFPASDGTQNPIPEDEIATTWNTSRNAKYGDYYEWVREDGAVWRWAAETPDEDDPEWRFTEDAEEPFLYIRDAPSFSTDPVRTGTVENKTTGEKFKVTLVFAKRILEPGEEMKMSGGERGCAHSHLRLWNVAAERSEPTLALEDDVHLTFERSAGMGKSNGKVFTERLALALKHAPSDFDVLYLGWSGWRGGHHIVWKTDAEGDPETRSILQKAEYVWTTVAYVISQAGAKKLLAAANTKVNQPVDNFMAWESSQGRLNSYVILDEGDDDNTWSGGLVDQFDFQGDSDIKKSDGGVQGDDAAEFAVKTA